MTFTGSLLEAISNCFFGGTQLAVLGEMIPELSQYEVKSMKKK
jgi:hypothetical protein